MSAIRTQEQALAEVHRLSEIISRQSLRHIGGGAAIQADAARTLAATFRELSAVYDRLPQLHSGRKPARWLADATARDAAELNQLRATRWDQLADTAQEEADRIARASEAVFAELTEEAGHRVGRDHARYRANLRSVK